MNIHPNSKRKNSEATYRMRAALCRAAGHPVRLAILDLLADGEVSNSELLGALGISKVNLSQHLSVLKGAGLVESRQQGRQVFHRLAFPEIREACRIIGDVLAQRLKQGTSMAEEMQQPDGGSTFRR